MKLINNIIVTTNPRLNVLISSTNEYDTNSDISILGEKLAKEIISFLTSHSLQNID